MRKGEPLVRDAFRLPAFRVIFVAEVISTFGSQLARFALSVLVYDRTNSASAAAITYATSFLPAVLGGVFLGHLGDRFRQRTVMITLDLIRGTLFCAMAIPGMPIVAILVLLTAATVLDPAFGSAQLSYLSGRLDDEQFRTASGLRSTADQITQVMGFGLGGVIVVALQPSGALLLDAATFGFSALMLWFLLERSARPEGEGGNTGSVVRRPLPQRRPLPRPRFASPQAPPASTGLPEPEAFAGLWRDYRTRIQIAFTMLVGLYVLPEALSVPYAAHVKAGTVASGILLATIPLGSALGCAVVLRVPAQRRRSVTRVLAVICGLPLVGCVAEPTWQVAGVCWFVCGLFTAYQMDVIAALVRAMPSRGRSRLIGIAGSWITLSQAVCFAVGGLLVGWIGPGKTIAVAGALGSVIALVVVLRSRRAI